MKNEIKAVACAVWWIVAAAATAIAIASLVPSEQTKAQGFAVGVAVTPLGYCQLSPVASTALSSCSGGIPTGANMVMLQAETANVRWRDDGTAPTGSVGMQVVSGNVPFAYNGTLTNLKFISATGVLDVAFYRVSSP